jgi:hypothetical protein
MTRSDRRSAGAASIFAVGVTRALMRSGDGEAATDPAVNIGDERD